MKLLFIISTALYFYENFTLDTVFNVNSFNTVFLIIKLQSFLFIFALSITESIQFIIGLMSVLTLPS